MQKISETNLSGIKRALVRVDFNIPLNTGYASRSDLLRIYSALPTIELLQNNGVQVVLVTHLGRKGESISEIESYLKTIIGEITYGNSWNKSVIEAELSQLGHKGIYMLPNIRTNPGEEANDVQFAKMLAGFADIYVNDAFSSSHRDHASIVGISQYIPAFAGMQMAREIDALTKLLSPENPTAMIIGGLKFETKMDLIEQYKHKGADIFVVGALAHPIYKAQGIEIGRSANDDSAQVGDLLSGDNVFVANTVVVENDGKASTKAISALLPDDKIVDAGMDWVKSLDKLLAQYKTIIWNGPLGWSEGGYIEGSRQLLNILSGLNAYRVIGGGDTVACIPDGDFDTVADFVSTGGGAMLEFLIQGTLPGIEALK